mgnify:CR=1 FL=1
MELVKDQSAVKVWLQALYDENGYLTPEIVRDAARDPASPAHGIIFGTGVQEAAEAFYLIQAHRLIQRISIVRPAKEDKPPTKLRAYHAIPGGEESAYIYVSAEDLVQRPDQMELARNEAIRRMRDAERSIEALDELATGTPTGRKAKKALKGVRTAREELSAA